MITRFFRWLLCDPPVQPPLPPPPVQFQPLRGDDSNALMLSYDLLKAGDTAAALAVMDNYQKEKAFQVRKTEVEAEEKRLDILKFNWDAVYGFRGMDMRRLQIEPYLGNLCTHLKNYAVLRKDTDPLLGISVTKDGKLIILEVK